MCHAAKAPPALFLGRTWRGHGLRPHGDNLPDGVWSQWGVFQAPSSYLVSLFALLRGDRFLQEVLFVGSSPRAVRSGAAATQWALTRVAGTWGPGRGAMTHTHTGRDPWFSAPSRKLRATHGDPEASAVGPEQAAGTEEPEGVPSAHLLPPYRTRMHARPHPHTHAQGRTRDTRWARSGLWRLRCPAPRVRPLLPGAQGSGGQWVRRGRPRPWVVSARPRASPAAGPKRMRLGPVGRGQRARRAEREEVRSRPGPPPHQEGSRAVVGPLPPTRQGLSVNTETRGPRGA